MKSLASKLISVFMVAAGAVHAADEITVAANLTINSSPVLQSQKSGDVILDMTNATAVYAGAVTLFTSGATSELSAAAVTLPGYLWAKNAATNTAYALYGGPTNAAGVILPIIKLQATEVLLVPRGAEPLFWTANTASNVPLQWFLITR